VVVALAADVDGGTLWVVVVDDFDDATTGVGSSPPPSRVTRAIATAMMLSTD
jgi:hypothetical protein